MRGLKNLLLEERKRLEKIIKVVQVQLKTMPEGSLRLSKSKEYIQYYHCTEENKIGKYIVNGNDELIQALAQKSYDEKLLQLAEKDCPDGGTISAITEVRNGLPKKE